MQVECVDCGEVITVPPEARPGDLLDCPNCAGHGLRLFEENGRWSARMAHRVSCPASDEVLTLPDDAKPGDVIECCGRRYRLTFEFGAFAAEEVARAAGARVKAATIGAGLVAGSGAVLSSLCCLLPLAIIALGLGSAGFMAVTMAYRWLLIPAGVLGIAAGVLLYVRERRRCRVLACRMAGGRVVLVALVAASAIVTTSIAVDLFPELTADLFGDLGGR